MDLNTLLAPHDEDNFFATCWERKPLHIQRGQPNYFSELLSLDGMNDLLSQLMFRTDECKVATEGQIVPASAYTAAPSMRVMERSVADYVDTPRLLGLFDQGATLVFSQLNQKLPALQKLKQTLERSFSATVVANVFLSNRRAQGFSVHYDSHDVFVLQLHGEKTWSLYGNPIELPMKSQAFGTTAVDKGPKTAEMTLRAGDLLYVPRGVFHEARTSETASLHLTLGVHPYLWADCVRDLVELVATQHVALRRSVPRGFSHLPKHDKQALLREVLGLLSESPAATRLASDLYQARVDQARQSGAFALPDHLNDILAGHGLSLAARLVRRGDLKLEVGRQQHMVTLSGMGQTLAFAPSHEAMVHAVSSAAAWTPEELPGSLDAPQRLAFARRLVGAGWFSCLPGNAGARNDSVQAGPHDEALQMVQEALL
jgi:ribosomal protein L16 Arg81 hydroxylase